MDFFSFQYSHTLNVALRENMFVGRMITGSLNYLQTSATGKLFSIRTQEERDNYATVILQNIGRYFDEMKKIYKEEVLNHITN